MKKSQFDKAEFTCFTEFLAFTDDTTQINLEDTISGFELFWYKWSELANKNKIDLNEINGRWSHKKVGNPLVYMERLLTILQNSRNLREQLDCLGGLEFVLHVAPEGASLSTIEDDLAFDTYQRCSLIQKGNDFYFYGNKANGTGWGLTKLDADIVQAEQFPFSILGKPFSLRGASYEQSFNPKHKKLYDHIAALGADDTQDQHILDNYGAYYASKYEGFHVVSQEMGLHYHPDKQNALPFHPDSTLYRTDLELLTEYCAAREEARQLELPTKELEVVLTKDQALKIKDNLFLISTEEGLLSLDTSVELNQEELVRAMEAKYGSVIPYNGQPIEAPYALFKARYAQNQRSNYYHFAPLRIRKSLPFDDLEKLTYEQIIERTFRFIGQQPKGISLIEFAKGARSAMMGAGERSNYFIAILFFVAHERYKGEVKLEDLLLNITHMNSHSELVVANNRSLVKLFQQDIRLSDKEGNALCQSVASMNAGRPAHLDTAYYINKLFLHLQNNKQGTLKMLQHFASPGNIKSFVYALDTAEYFMKNPSIAGFYYNDLLLFSALINANAKESYFEGRKDNESSTIHQNMERVNEILLKAATGTQPNNLDYAIKAIIQSRTYFTFTKFLKACQEIEALETFDDKATEAILTKNEFILQASVPEIFSRDNDTIKGALILTLITLERAENGNINLTPVVDASEKEISDVNDKIQVFEKLDTLHAQRLMLDEQGLPIDEEIKLLETKLSDSSPKAKIQQKKLDTLRAQRLMLNEQSLPIDKEIKLLETKLSGSSLNALKTQQKKLKLQREEYQSMLIKMAVLNQLTMKELQSKLQQEWTTKGMLFSFAAKAILAPILLQLRNHVIHQAFSALGESAFITQLEKQIYDLNSFKEADNFESLDRIANEANSLARQFNEILKHQCFIVNEEELTQIFSKIDYASYDYKTLFAMLDMLVNMPERDYREVLSQYIQVSNNVSIAEKMDLINDIRTLHNNQFPSTYITAFISRPPKIKNKSDRTLFLQQIITTFQRDQEDPLLNWMIKGSIEDSSLLAISTLTQGITNNRAAVSRLFAMMNTAEKPILKDFLGKTDYPEEVATKIIEILAISYAATPAALLKKNPVDYIQLTTMLGQLNKENINLLYSKLSKTSIAITCLNHSLKNRDEGQPFNEFLKEFEKNPFGSRDFGAQFDTEHVERVVNNFVDLNNKSAYSYYYRKQMMEAFLFVNRAGFDLPVYNNKAAKDLSNDEITQLFFEIKSGHLKHLDSFQTRLYALGLMREAMYRTTGQYPYSTQMLTLIDCMMHQGDVISNIDTGQGKSMIDTMKATLLWLGSGRVDLTTASLIDAKRDLDIYSPFWSLLGIPFSKKPISSTSPFDAYEKQGINVGTIAQFALFYSKAKGEQVDLDSDQVSLVMNESDYTILDDRTVYRYASTGGPGLIGAGKEWIYDAINQFVTRDAFKANTTSEAQDIAALKKYLLKQAKLQKKSSKFIESFPDKKWLMLLESALIVNYRLKENFDYVLTKKPEVKLINGEIRETRSAKIIMKDGKVSSDTQYGNGMQQLLYSKLNKIHGRDSFVIEPESKTIISTNNKNMIDYYRSKKGFIWGSSGTVGFGREIDLQYQKYGFEFSKVEPHQLNITKLNKPTVSADEKAQFEHIIQLLKLKNTSNEKKAPVLVIFKDIETATRFHAYLQDQYKTQAMQLYTGLGNEEQAIHNAAQAGMITITTPALGRNTDIHYDKSVGMDVIETFVASAREDRQKAGRTGRQGSKGNVYYSLNQDDLGNKTIPEVRAPKLASVVSQEKIDERLVDELAKNITESDKANAKVATKSLDSMKQHNQHFKENLSTMSGRTQHGVDNDNDDAGHTQPPKH